MYSPFVCSEDANGNSLLDIRVYCQSQTKKKGKRKKEVAASVGHPLGLLVKKQDLEKSKFSFSLFDITPSSPLE